MSNIGRTIMNLVIVLMMGVLLFLLVAFGSILGDSMRTYNTSSYMLLLYIEDGAYEKLVSNIKYIDPTEEEDTTLLECYYLGEYFRVASQYKMYSENGLPEKAATEAIKMEELAGKLGNFAYCTEEIGEILQIEIAN